MLLLEKNMHEICEGEKRNYDIDVDGVASVEEAEWGQVRIQ